MEAQRNKEALTTMVEKGIEENLALKEKIRKLESKDYLEVSKREKIQKPVIAEKLCKYQAQNDILQCRLKTEVKKSKDLPTTATNSCTRNAKRLVDKEKASKQDVDLESKETYLNNKRKNSVLLFTKEAFDGSTRSQIKNAIQFLLPKRRMEKKSKILYARHLEV